MEWLKNINGAVNNVVWGVPMLILLLGSGVFLSVRTGYLQFSKFGYAIKNTLGKLFVKQKAGSGSMTPAQALTTALAATVGTGNIAGITAAITLGGAGAIFWLWVSALIGMCTKYAEVLLAVKFRERNIQDDLVGGPMYYITNGLGSNWKWLANIFCIFGALAAFGIGNATQVSAITSSVISAIDTFYPAVALTAGEINFIVGVVIAAIVGLVIIGGVKRLGSVTEKLVPFMSIIYIAGCLAVIIANFSSIGGAFSDIFKGAFMPSAALGGAAGITVKSTITWGLKRGVFSNEAGLGSAPIAHATTSETDPVKQGLYGIFEVFVDTIVICTLTGLALLMSGIDIRYGVQGTTVLNTQAFATVFGDKLGSLIIAVGITLFAIATIVSWSLYGARCAEYLLGPKSIRIYQIVFILVTIVGATMDISLVWDISDTLNGLMAIPNLIALLGLSGVVVKLTKEHFRRKNGGLGGR